MRGHASCGLDSWLGEGRWLRWLSVEALGQAVQIIGHCLKVLADCCALLGLSGTVITELSDSGDLLIDVFRHVALFFGCRRHLLAHLGDATHGLADTDQGRLHRLDTLHAFAGNLLTFAGR
ncbi:hypothetical protein D3C72_2094450 [compost metagenome]